MQNAARMIVYEEPCMEGSRILARGYVLEAAAYHYRNAMRYAKLLQEAGIGVTLNETRGTMHGFDIATKASITLAVMEQRIEFTKRMI